MANETINQQTEDTAPTVDDFLLLWDVTTGTTKKASLLKLLLKILNGGSDWALQSFTPSYSNLTEGAGANTGHYIQVGKIVIGHTHWIFGAGAVMGTAPALTLPVAAAASYIGAVSDIGDVGILDSGTANFGGLLRLTDANTAQVIAWGVGGTYQTNTTITATVPMTWATGDRFDIRFIYEAA